MTIFPKRRNHEKKENDTTATPPDPSPIIQAACHSQRPETALAVPNPLLYRREKTWPQQQPRCDLRQRGGYRCPPLPREGRCAGQRGCLFLIRMPFILFEKSCRLVFEYFPKLQSLLYLCFQLSFFPLNLTCPLLAQSCITVCVLSKLALYRT